MVVLNKIYTRTGDDGTTGLATGERVEKWNPRVECYGAVDEANSAIGVARLHAGADPELDAMLNRIQNDLFDLGADLATPERDKPLGTAGDCARDVEMSRKSGAGGQDEAVEGRDRPIYLVDLGFEAGHLSLDDAQRRPGERRVAFGCGEIGAEIEEVVLDAA